MDDQLVGPLDLDAVEAKLHFEGLQIAEVRALITQLRQAREALINLAIENKELEALFDLQHQRQVEAIQRWQREAPDGSAMTFPDYGRLLDWMHARLLLLEANPEGASE